MTERYYYCEHGMYVVDHVVRKDASIPFTPFKYTGWCEVTMHAQGSSVCAVYELYSPKIMMKQEAQEKYPEWFI